MTRDLRLLPAAVLGWCACLTATRLRPEGVAVLVLAGLAVVVAATARLRAPQRGRHRRAAPGRAAASLLLTAVVVTAALAWAGARSELRRATVEPLLRTSVMATHDTATLDRALDAFASVKAAFEAEHGPLPAP